MRKRYFLAAAAASGISLGIGSSAQAASIYFTDSAFDGFGIPGLGSPSTLDQNQIAGAPGSILNSGGVDRTFQMKQGGERWFNVFFNPMGITPTSGLKYNSQTTEYTIDNIYLNVSTVPPSGEASNTPSKELNLFGFYASNLGTTALTSSGQNASISSSSLTPVNTNQFGWTISNLTFKGLDYPSSPSLTGTPIWLGSFLVGAKDYQGSQDPITPLVADGEPDVLLSLGKFESGTTLVGTRTVAKSVRNVLNTPVSDPTFALAGGANGFPDDQSRFDDQPFTVQSFGTTTLPNGNTVIPIQGIDATPVPLESDLAGFAALGGLGYLTWKKRRNAIPKVVE